MRYVAIDLGSSFTKGAILDTDRLAIGYEQRLPTPGNSAKLPTRYEIDPELYFQQVHTLLDGLLDQAPDSAGILFSTQMHGFLLSDQGFKPLTPYVSWRDAASNEMNRIGMTFLDQLRSALTPETLANAGVPCKANLAISNLYARLQTGLNVPDGTCFHTLGSYMAGRLGAEPVCHLTNAAPTGLANIVHASWNDDLLTRTGCHRLVLPRITRQLEICGHYHYRDKTYLLYPDIGDHQCCVLGSLTRPELDWNVNIGTAGLLGLITGEYARGDFETRPFFDGYYLRSISGLPGGRHLDILAGFLADIQSKIGGHPDLDRIWQYLVQCEADSQLEIDFQDCFSRGGWIRQIGTDFDLDELIGGTYAYMARYYQSAALKIGGRASRVMFSGGCTQRNPALRRRILREMGLPGVAPQRPGEVIGGLLQLALIIEGRASSITEAQEIMREYVDNQGG